MSLRWVAISILDVADVLDAFGCAYFFVFAQGCQIMDMWPDIATLSILALCLILCRYDGHYYRPQTVAILIPAVADVLDIP